MVIIHSNIYSKMFVSLL